MGIEITLLTLAPILAGDSEPARGTRFEEEVSDELGDTFAKKAKITSQGVVKETGESFYDSNATLVNLLAAEVGAKVLVKLVNSESRGAFLQAMNKARELAKTGFGKLATKLPKTAKALKFGGKALKIAPVTTGYLAYDYLKGQYDEHFANTALLEFVDSSFAFKFHKEDGAYSMSAFIKPKEENSEQKSVVSIVYEVDDTGKLIEKISDEINTSEKTNQEDKISAAYRNALKQKGEPKDADEVFKKRADTIDGYTDLIDGMDSADKETADTKKILTNQAHYINETIEFATWYASNRGSALDVNTKEQLKRILDRVKTYKEDIGNGLDDKLVSQLEKTLKAEIPAEWQATGATEEASTGDRLDNLDNETVSYDVAFAQNIDQNKLKLIVDSLAAKQKLVQAYLDANKGKFNNPDATQGKLTINNYGEVAEALSEAYPEQHSLEKLLASDEELKYYNQVVTANGNPKMPVILEQLQSQVKTNPAQTSTSTNTLITESTKPNVDINRLLSKTSNALLISDRQSIAYALAKLFKDSKDNKVHDFIQSIIPKDPTKPSNLTEQQLAEGLKLIPQELKIGTSQKKFDIANERDLEALKTGINSYYRVLAEQLVEIQEQPQ